jgi:hypothetical protein
MTLASDGGNCGRSGKAFLDFVLSLDELLDWREQLKQAENVAEGRELVKTIEEEKARLRKLGREVE